MTVVTRTCLLFILITHALSCWGQPVTGVWRGRVTKGNGLLKQTYKLEVKLVKNGDSITGTSYYYASANNYFRYAIKGYFGAHDNSINWWDDQLIESKSPNVKLASANSQPLLSIADYNCPGSGVMLLDGSTKPTSGDEQYGLHLQKMEHPEFRDEWDPIIEAYFDGGADPYLIDSVSRIAFTPRTVTDTFHPAINTPQQTTVYQPLPSLNKPALPPAEPATLPVAAEKEPELVANPWAKEAVKQQDSVTVQTEKPLLPEPVPVAKVTPPLTTPKAETIPAPVVKPTDAIKADPPTIEEKFARRKNVLNTTIPIAGDTIEFKFYDNAEVDGDSISIFLNGKMLQTHIRLTSKGYSIKIPVISLQAGDNELVMVAENLGSIPPNTAYMEAWSGGKRYTARMESTEGSSAMIRLQQSTADKRPSTGKP